MTASQLQSSALAASNEVVTVAGLPLSYQLAFADA
jgi:hypothetical protein